MYQAKRERTGWAGYDAERDLHSRARLALVEDLRRALQRDELVLVYQPKAELRTGRVAGVEALVRWQHPTRGLLGPASSSPSPKRPGLMRRLTARVLTLAVAQAARLRTAGLPLTVAVNVSATDLVDTRFPDEVEQCLVE